LVVGKLLAHLSPKERQKIIKQSAMYSWVQGYLFHIGPDLIIHVVFEEDEIYDILKYCHDEPCGGNFVDKRIMHKVLHLGYYWPSIFEMPRST
jgi:hypothetical protein